MTTKSKAKTKTTTHAKGAKKSNARVTKNTITSAAVSPKRTGKIRYAVVGLGHIAQNAILPGFAHAKNSELAALISGDAKKLKSLAKKYNVPATYSYDDYEACLASGLIDAVYIALPNNMHREYTEIAAKHGIHVLCEKPLAVTPEDCAAMIKATDKAGVKLMAAYRLHFEPANLSAIEVANSGKIGEARYMISTFSEDVRSGNIRTKQEMGGGPAYDIGIYCINAARYIMRQNPTEVFAYGSRTKDARFREVDEMDSIILRFPDGKFASFTCSFSCATTGRYEVVGTKGSVMLENAYDYVGGSELITTVKKGNNKKVTRKRFGEVDQFAAELVYFSDCVLKNRQPEPNGVEGMIDVEIIRAILESIKTGKAVKLNLETKTRMASVRQEMHEPTGRRPKLVDVESPSIN